MHRKTGDSGAATNVIRMRVEEVHRALKAGRRQEVIIVGEHHVGSVHAA
jgi:hypothetical protein